TGDSRRAAAHPAGRRPLPAGGGSRRGQSPHLGFSRRRARRRGRRRLSRTGGGAMLMYGWMKWVEIAPDRYDWAVKVMTFGRLDQIKDRIAAMVRPGDRVLDVGCGTGTLALRCLERGALVTGLDSAKHMIEQSARRAEEAGMADRLTLVQDSVTQLRKHFLPQSFDVIVSTMVLGEFPRQYLDFVMQDCRALLRPGGRLIIADEVFPESVPGRLVYSIG